MDAAADSSELNGKPVYTTSKQVQAWFLRLKRCTKSHTAPIIPHEDQKIAGKTQALPL
jgi:hypothetical protein